LQTAGLRRLGGQTHILRPDPERTWLEDVLRRFPEYELGKEDLGDLLPATGLPPLSQRKLN